MTSVKSFNHIAINVVNLERSLKFYEEGLGLRKTLVKSVGKDSWKLLRLPPNTTGRTSFLQGENRESGQIELAQWELPVPDGAVPKRAGDPGPWVLSFSVDADKMTDLHARLTEMGYDCYTEPVSNLIENYGTITMFICEDPDGNQIELISLPSREEVKAYRATSQKTGSD